MRKTQALACSGTISRLIMVSVKGFLIHSRHVQIFALTRVEEVIDVDIIIILVVGNVFAFGRLLQYRRSQQFLVPGCGGNDRWILSGGGNDRRFLSGVGNNRRCLAGGDICFFLHRFLCRLRGPNDRGPPFRGGAGRAVL